MSRDKTRPKIAVALAAYNGMEWIDEQFDSILKQQGVEVTLFVSVDCSNDGTEAYVQSMSVQDERIVLLPQLSSAGGAALNFYRLVRDIDLDAFDSLALSDQDDIWLPDRLIRAHRAMQQHQAVAYSSNVTAFWPDGRQLLVDKAQRQRKWDFLFETAGPGCSYVFQINLARQIQSFVSQNWETIIAVSRHDWLFYAYARARQIPWYIDSRSGLLYRQHQTNQVGANLGWRMARQRLALIRAGWYRQQVQLIASISGSSDPFVCKVLGPQWWRSWYILLHITQTRRRFRDRCVLGLCCLFNLL
jgi:rhamnosyltransferase